MYIPFADAPVSGIDDISPKMIQKLKDAAKRKFENVSKDVLNFISM